MPIDTRTSCPSEAHQSTAESGVYFRSGELCSYVTFNINYEDLKAIILTKRAYKNEIVSYGGCIVEILKDDERLDYLISDGKTQIIQSPTIFSYSLDAVLLAHFTYVPINKGDILDL